MTATAVFAPPAVHVPARSPSDHSESAPPMLCGADCVAQLPREWFVVSVQTRREKALAWTLWEKVLPYYLPLTRIVRRVNGVKRQTIPPLFPNYLFGCGAAAEEHCRSSRHVLSIIPVSVGSQARLVRELSNLELALFGNPSLEVCDVAAVGQRVRVVAGPFEGAEGVVEDFLESGKFHRVVIGIETLGRAVSFEVDKADLESF